MAKEDRPDCKSGLLYAIEWVQFPLLPPKLY